jgi:sigma-B regulation protein RsbU (phosphoserine phosphatase)
MSDSPSSGAVPSPGKVPPSPAGPTIRGGSGWNFSRIRHELRTPINHVLGYCEMLLEDPGVPPAFHPDLQRIHTGGRQLLALITRCFDEETFSPNLDLHQLYHDLRTPVNHIIGYSELMQEQAQESGHLSLLPDLGKIHEAARTWLELMSGYLIGLRSQPDAEGGGSAGETSLDLGLGPGVGFQTPLPRSAEATRPDVGSLLIVDDDPANRDMLSRRLERQGYKVSVASSGMQALQHARREKFDLVLLDMIMPGLDGMQVLARFKSEPGLREIPVIMLSALDQEDGIARCVEMGAEDYLSKPFNPIFLRARIGACLEKKRLLDKERATHQALMKSQKHLASELANAASYVRSLLPDRLQGAIQADWCFEPCEQLGGDAFGYHWLDPEHFAIYLLDVCGHGVGSALLSVSAANVLRAQSLSGVDFRKPAEVLSGLNRTFRMERHNNLYFTLWYGVFCPARRNLAFASGGHPPAVLLSGADAPIALQTGGPAVGCLEEAEFSDAQVILTSGSRLVVLSDGVYEIENPTGQTGSYSQYFALFSTSAFASLTPKEQLEYARCVRGGGVLEDDFSLIDLRFP